MEHTPGVSRTTASVAAAAAAAAAVFSSHAHVGKAKRKPCTRRFLRRCSHRPLLREARWKFVGQRTQLSRPGLTPSTAPATALAALGEAGSEEVLESSLALAAAMSPTSGATLATLAAAIWFHESGHFLCAKSVGLPAAEFSLGFGPELLSSAPNASSDGPPDDAVTFKDAENDTVRLERFGGAVRVVVNENEIWRGLPELNGADGTLLCGESGSCKVAEENIDDVTSLLKGALEVTKDEMQKKIEDTVFTLRMLPIGGYVRFDERKIAKLADGTMATQLDSLPIVSQVWVYAGGVLANMATAFTALCIGAVTSGIPDSKPLPGIRVETLSEEAVLRTNLRPKDVMLQIGSLDLHAPGHTTSETVDFIRRLPAQEPVAVLVDRAGREMWLDIVPLTDPKTGLQRLGVNIVSNSERIFLKADDLLQAAKIASDNIQHQFGAQITALQGLLNFSGSSAGEVIGPVGILKQGTELTEADGLIGLAMFFVSVNLNLALLNALPVPALDGGKIMFTLAGKLLGKPVDEQKKQDVEGIFIILVFVLVAGLTLKDVARMFSP